MQKPRGQLQSSADFHALSREISWFVVARINNCHNLSLCYSSASYWDSQKVRSKASIFPSILCSSRATPEPCRALLPMQLLNGGTAPSKSVRKTWFSSQGLGIWKNKTEIGDPVLLFVKCKSSKFLSWFVSL